MQDERPTQEMSESSADESAPGIMAETGRRGGSGLLIAGVVVVVILIVAGLFLPPISLGERLGLGGEETAAETSEPTTPLAGTELPGEATLTVVNSVEAGLGRVAQADFLAGSAGDEWQAALAGLPSNAVLKSPVFAITSDGDPVGTASLMIPADAAPAETLDLYGWTGETWVFLPSHVDQGTRQVMMLEGDLPEALALMQVAAPESLTVAVQVGPSQVIAADLLPYLTDVSVAGLRLSDGASVTGEPADVPAGGYRQWLRLSNEGPVVDEASLMTLLGDAALQAEVIADLLARVETGGYAGVHLDLQGAPAASRADFTAFVDALATALDGAGSSLALTMATPVMLSNGSWDTGGQDPATLGRLADVVFLRLPVNPTEYADGGLADQALGFLTREVDRRALLLLASASSVEGVGEAYRELSGDEALANFGSLGFVQGSEEVAPGDPVEVALSGSASPLEWDGTGVAYKYTYEANDSPHTVWLSNEAAINHRLRFGQKYHVAGVALRSPGDDTVGETGLAAILSYLGEAEAPVPQGAAIVWTVLNESGGIQANSNGESLTYLWEAPQEPGEFVVRADFAQGEIVNALGEIGVAVVSPVAEETETDESEATAQAESLDESDETEEAGDQGADEETSETAAGDVTARVNTAANVRSGPGLGYQVIAGAEQGTTVPVTGRNSGSNWLQVILPDEQQGWIFAQLLDVTGAVSGLAVIEVDPPVASASSGGGTPAPAPAPGIAPVPTGSFALGGQTHTLASPAQMQYTGMTWVKFQHKWGSGDSPNAVQGRIDSAHANGFKVLLSIPGANTYPSSIDFNAYVEFLRGVAALGPDAIEIWNEQNIDFEWPAGSIDPASYVNNMLAPAYNAIKSANPNVMVISGAPAPTGFFGGGCGTNGCDDNAYLAGMAAAGAASYMDCVGVHYNAGATSPTVSSGHPAGGTHYSWYFQPTMDLYYNAFGGSRPVCFTELGYLSGQDFGGVPSRFSWAGNTTVAQHAQWLAEAVSLAANSGKVRMVIIFNVDFTYYAEDPQAGFAMIRPDGSCPSCDLLANIMGSR